MLQDHQDLAVMHTIVCLRSVRRRSHKTTKRLTDMASLKAGVLLKYSPVMGMLTVAIMSHAPVATHDLCCMQDGTALSIDLLGSCFTDQLRPPTLMPHHLTQYLHQGASSPALRAVESSLGVARGQGQPALGAESSMASVSAVTAGSEQGLERESESDAAGASLPPVASTVDQASQDSLKAFHGEQEACVCCLVPSLFTVMQAVS